MQSRRRAADNAVSADPPGVANCKNGRPPPAIEAYLTDLGSCVTPAKHTQGAQAQKQQCAGAGLGY